MLTTDLALLVCATVLTFVMIVFASVVRSRGWSPPGLKIAFGNRDDLPEHTPLTSC